MKEPRSAQPTTPRNHRPAAWRPDKGWAEEQWYDLLSMLVQERFCSWKEIAALALGHLNPPQVGTSLATNKNVQAIYGKGKTWQRVREWFYSRTGKCINCGTRLELQADHIVSKQSGGKDNLENFQLLCRRCNVIKRPSHKQGGLTFLTAEAALMWLLLVYQPASYDKFAKLCRRYGLTMADIRFQEAWAMAEWLRREGKYPSERFAELARRAEVRPVRQGYRSADQSGGA